MEAITDLEKLKGYVEDIRIAMICTKHGNHLHSRPMATSQIDEDGNLWFFTNEFSEKADQVAMDPHVLAVYSDLSRNIYLSVRGTAELVDDREKMKELFNPAIKAWFPEGLNDPKLILLRIITENADYWDSGVNKMVTLFNMVKAVITGDQYSQGKHGTLSI